MNRLGIGIGLLVATITTSVYAEDLHLADNGAWPGKWWVSVSGQRERETHARAPQALSSAPGMIPRLAQVCVLPGGKRYFCSGLDGYLFHIVEGGHEVVIGQKQEQIRDLVAGENDHVLYFSTLPTPQNNEPLADGKIYRYDLYDGGPRHIATVPQGSVGNAWWGLFARREGDIYIATTSSPSRVYRLQGNQPELVWETARRVTGVTFNAQGDLLFATGGKQAFRTNFQTEEIAWETTRNFSEIAIGAE